MTERPLAVRLQEELIARLDAIAGELSGRASGVPVARSVVIRQAIERGVASFEAELGVAPSRQRKRK